MKAGEGEAVKLEVSFSLYPLQAELYLPQGPHAIRHGSMAVSRSVVVVCTRIMRFSICNDRRVSIPKEYPRCCRLRCRKGCCDSAARFGQDGTSILQFQCFWGDSGLRRSIANGRGYAHRTAASVRAITFFHCDHFIARAGVDISSSASTSPDVPIGNGSAIFKILGGLLCRSPDLPAKRYRL